LKKINNIIFSFIFVLSISSIIFCDVSSSVTSLVGRNAEGYLAPLGTMMGSGMNSGYYRKAAPHKILGFDFTLDLVYSMAPAGKTTYNFYIPNDSINFPFQFQFPRSMFSSVMGNWESVIPAVEDNGALYQDQTITFGLAVKDLLNAGDSNIRAQNILGNDSSAVLVVTLDKAIPTIFDQVIDNTWNIVDTIPGLGEEYEFIPGQEIKLFNNKDDFETQFGDSISALIETGLGGMAMPELLIPGGFGKKFNTLPIDIGLPMPILQASFGLPFHTELTVRGLPVAMSLPSLGSIKFGGFGGKIGISEFFKEKPKKQPKIQISPKIKYVLEELPSNITPADIDAALAEIRSTSMDLTELDDLNNKFNSGDSLAIYDILTQLGEISTFPKAKKVKPKGWPVDVSLGFYTNNLELDMGDSEINSINNLLSLQAGKTFDLPFISFLGGLGLYGGISLESSDLNLKYTLANPIAYGCFSGTGESKTYEKGIIEKDCSGDTKEWGSGVPTDINLKFPGENKFRTTIGARIRILIMDVYIDYNTGASNAINAGIGITFR